VAADPGGGAAAGGTDPPPLRRATPVEWDGADEAALGRLADDGGPAADLPYLTAPEREAVVVRFRPLAFGLAYRWWQMNRAAVALDDMRQEAVVGLVLAARRYDPTRGTSYLTYATYWVEMRLRRFRARESNAGARVPNETEMRYVHRPVSLDQPIGATKGDLTRSPRGPLLADDTERDPTEEGGASLDRAAFWREVNRWLDPRQAEVVRLRFVEGLTLDAVGATFGITRERVRQLEVKILARLAGRMDFTGFMDTGAA
jgi:RNA polymerase sigma factor (sigma-70 family)